MKHAKNTAQQKMYASFSGRALAINHILVAVEHITPLLI
jgi:hypothetical protein